MRVDDSSVEGYGAEEGVNLLGHIAGSLLQQMEQTNAPREYAKRKIILRKLEVDCNDITVFETQASLFGIKLATTNGTSP